VLSMFFSQMRVLRGVGKARGPFFFSRAPEKRRASSLLTEIDSLSVLIPFLQVLCIRGSSNIFHLFGGQGRCLSGFLPSSGGEKENQPFSSLRRRIVFLFPPCSRSIIGVSIREHSFSSPSAITGHRYCPLFSFFHPTFSRHKTGPFFSLLAECYGSILPITRGWLNTPFFPTETCATPSSCRSCTFTSIVVLLFSQTRQLDPASSSALKQRWN